jgi:hypothetical protein
MHIHEYSRHLMHHKNVTNHMLVYGIAFEEMLRLCVKCVANFILKI